MEAKDTVMDEVNMRVILRDACKYWATSKNEDKDGFLLKNLEDVKQDFIAQAQAEISFKMGYNQALKDIKAGLMPSEHNKEVERLIKQARSEGYKAGEDKGYAHARQHCEDVIIPQAETQARRKVVEWVECSAGLGAKTIEELNEGYTFIPIRTDKWQVQKKEWGL